MAFDVPETILLQILSYLPLPQRWQVGRVNRTWHRVSLDPYLYRDLLFENLEFKELLWALQRVIDIAPRVRTLTIDRCYSNFIQNIVVPVHFSNDAPKRPQFFSHIRTLQPARRRQEYLKHGFELHNQFSDAINQLLEMNQNTLVSAKILNCDLDFEMTELFCAIACFGQQLTTFEYANNGDKGLHSSGLLQAIVTSCPNMRHFRGLHAGMDDAVLMTIARHWPHLESLTLCSIKSRDMLDHTELISNGRELRGASPTGNISSRAFWELLSKCRCLHTLELHDLACVSNRDLLMYESLRKAAMADAATTTTTTTTTSTAIKRTAKDDRRFKPYTLQKPAHPAETCPLDSSAFAGGSVRKLRITKYTTTPLSKPGFETLLRVFPNMTHLEYTTNFQTFDNQFQDVTREMFDAESSAVEQWMATQHHLSYIGQWDDPTTDDQRLMAGMTSV